MSIKPPNELFTSPRHNIVVSASSSSTGSGQNPSRQAAMKAGVPQEVPSTGVNMLCGSGLRAVVLASQAIRCGDAALVVAGGQESMSQVTCM